MTTENNQSLSLYMKNPQETEKAQVVQTGCKDILVEQGDSALMTHLINSLSQPNLVVSRDLLLKPISVSTLFGCPKKKTKFSLL